MFQVKEMLLACCTHATCVAPVSIVLRFCYRQRVCELWPAVQIQPIASICK